MIENTVHTRKGSYYLAGIIALVTLAVYLPALKNDFVLWDDNVIIYNNLHIRSWGPDFFMWAFSTRGQSLWEPVTWMSYALDYTLWGSNPAGYHMTNILLHAANTFLVVCLIIRLVNVSSASLTPHLEWVNAEIGVLPGRGKESRISPFINDRTILIAAGTTGILFGIHPLHVESVAWVSARNDILCGLFFLLSVLAYANYVITAEIGTGKKITAAFLLNRQYLFSLLLFVLAVSSKPIAVILPGVLLLLDWYPFKRMLSLKYAPAFAEKLPFIIISLVVSMVTFYAQQGIGSLDTLDGSPLSGRVLIVVKALSMYLWNMAFPLRLVPFYPYPEGLASSPWPSLLSVMVVSGITTACLLTVKKHPIALAAWLYFCITLLPVLGFAKVRQVYMADRYTYLSSLGPFLLAGLFFAHLWEKAGHLKSRGHMVRRLCIAIALSLLFSLSFLTVQQTAVWKNSIELWSYVLDKESGGVPVAYINRGIAFREKGRFDRAVEDFNAVLAGRHSSRDAYLVYNARGKTFAAMGLLEQGIADFDNAISLDPQRHMAYVNRGLTRGKAGQFEGAIEDLDKALSLDGTDDNAYAGRGLVFAETGRMQRALEDFDTAITINPANGDAYLNRGLTFERMGQAERALSDYSKVIALNPSDYLAFINRGILFSRRGSFDRAIDDFSRTIALKPDFAEAYLERGDAYLKAGSPEFALKDYKKTCELGIEEGCDAVRNYENR